MNELNFPEQALSYWKAHITMRDVLACELAFSLIYNNILPEKLDTALATAELTSLPNRLLLIQVDDYTNHSSKLRITQEYFQKAVLVNMLREALKEQHLSGFVANLIGTDKIACFLCCEETEDTDQQLLSLASEFIAYIRQKSAYTISLCVSEPCLRLSQYSEIYPHMEQTLKKSFFSGRESRFLLEKRNPRTENTTVSAALSNCYPEFLISVTRQNRSQFDAVTEHILQQLSASNLPAQDVQLEVIRLLQHAEDHYLQCGAEEQAVQNLHRETISKILNCSFLLDLRSCLNDYYVQISRLFVPRHESSEYAFKLLVEKYVAAHFHETIRLGTLAVSLGFSEGHFTRLFRKEFGVTFVQYLTEYRMEQSKRLLAESNVPIEQIAYRVGIGNYSYFCTCFKRSYGMSPGNYRKKVAAKRKNEQTASEVTAYTSSLDFEI